MRRTEKVLVPAREEERLLGYKCDVCGTPCGQLGWPDRSAPNDGYASEETELSIKRGTHYPEGGRSTEEKWDLCPACFDKHIRPVLEALGAQPRKTESDW